jgi:hypothetical protein
MTTSIILCAPDDARICSRQITALPAGAVFGVHQACNDVLPGSSRRFATRCIGFRVGRRRVFIKIPYKRNCAGPELVRHKPIIATRRRANFSVISTRSTGALAAGESAHATDRTNAVRVRSYRIPECGRDLWAAARFRSVSLMEFLSPALALRLVSIWRFAHLCGCGRP